CARLRSPRATSRPSNSTNGWCPGTWWAANKDQAGRRITLMTAAASSSAWPAFQCLPEQAGRQFRHSALEVRVPRVLRDALCRIDRNAQRTLADREVAGVDRRAFMLEELAVGR
ncbi:MAG: hypothetical protein WKG52_05625, partial [Variovorax sp.]